MKYFLSLHQSAPKQKTKQNKKPKDEEINDCSGCTNATNISGKGCHFSFSKTGHFQARIQAGRPRRAPPPPLKKKKREREREREREKGGRRGERKQRGNDTFNKRKNVC